ncbi:MAG: hypothetical protein QXJ75_00370 [Candidatus Bathyarchaeia archaeon]
MKKVGKQSFKAEDAKRLRYAEYIRSVGVKPLETGKWEELKEFIYKPRNLQTDVIMDDTTLREGLQMAGLTSPSSDDMCKIGCLLRDIGIERIEVMTFTKTDQEAVKKMQDAGLGKLLAAWCRAAIEDIDIALKFGFEQVGISHPVSYIHFVKWSEKSLGELVDKVVDSVIYARKHGLQVFVHGEDSTRADWSFEKKFINAVADAGAITYRICDTVGCGLSDQKAPLPAGIPEKIKRIKKETRIPYVEIHAHDDLGNAVENTMAAIRAASGLYDKVYASTTFLGIGDRAGNAETEKIIMNCYLHYNVKKWNLKYLREMANFLASSLNYHLPLNKAIVGDAAFEHESGIHLFGLKMHPLTYEIFPPELVGQERRVVIGKRSGKYGIQMKVEDVIGEKVDEKDSRLLKLVELIRDEFMRGERRFAFTEEEFKELARKVGFEIKNDAPPK